MISCWYKNFMVHYAQERIKTQWLEQGKVKKSYTIRLFCEFSVGVKNKSSKSQKDHVL